MVPLKVLQNLSLQVCSTNSRILAMIQSTHELYIVQLLQNLVKGRLFFYELCNVKVQERTLIRILMRLKITHFSLDEPIIKF